MFPLGTTTVTCTATDKAGNTGTESFTVTVTAAWSNVLQPVNADGSSIFKLGSTVPVKFQLTGASAGITNLSARLYLQRIGAGTTGTTSRPSRPRTPPPATCSATTPQRSVHLQPQHEDAERRYIPAADRPGRRRSPHREHIAQVATTNGIPGRQKGPQARSGLGPSSAVVNTCSRWFVSQRGVRLGEKIGEANPPGTVADDSPGWPVAADRPGHRDRSRGVRAHRADRFVRSVNLRLFRLPW